MKMNKFAAALSLGAVVLSANVFAIDPVEKEGTNLLVYATVTNEGLITDETGKTLDNIVIELQKRGVGQKMAGSPIKGKGSRVAQNVYLSSNAGLDAEFDMHFVPRDDKNSNVFKISTQDKESNIEFSMLLNGKPVATPQTKTTLKVSEPKNGIHRVKLNLDLESKNAYEKYTVGEYESFFDVIVAPKAS